MADISSALERARRMIKSDAKADAHIIRERVADRNNAAYFKDQPNDAYSMMSSVPSNSHSLNEDYDDGSYADDRFNNALDGLMSSRSNSLNEQQMMGGGEMISAASKLPKEILESLSTNPIEGKDVFHPDYELLKAKKLMEENDRRAEVARQKSVIAETPQQVSAIDYSLIKTIVEECMRKYAGSIIKKILTENKGSGEDSLKAIKIGDKFSFITSNGDLYEAELKFKKNVNKK